VGVGRLAGEADLGIYTIGLSVALLLAAVQDSMISIPYTFFRERGARERAYAGSVLVHHAMLAGAATVLLALAALVFLFVPGSTRLAGPAGALAVVIPGVLAHELARRMAFAHHRVGAALVVDAAAATIQLGGLVALALADRLSATTALVVLGAGRGLAGGARLAVIRHAFDLHAGGWGETFQRHWRFARYDLSAQVVGAVEGYAAYWILAFVRGPEATGVLAASTTVAMVANPILLGLHNVFVPRIADAQEAGPAEIWRVVRQTTLLYLVLMSGFCAVMIVFGGSVLGFLYGAEFAGHGEVVAVLAVLALVGATEMTAANGLRAFGRPRAYLVASAVGLAVIVLVGPPLCIAWGALGAAATVLASGTVETGIEWAWLRRLRTGSAPPP
jgi:O-antigen/teichoic acid export membrane protein